MMGGVAGWSSILLLLIHLGAPLEARRAAAGRAQTRRIQQQQQQQQQQQMSVVTRERLEGAESFPLDFTAVEDNMDSFMVQIKNLAQSLYKCSSQKLDQDMKLHLLRNVSVTCNDGSPAGYYLRESKGSKRWLLYLEGGWYCFNKQTCDRRYETMRSLMSSADWPQTRTESGILSPQPEQNPYWWNANTVFIPYCSSDNWSGASPPRADDGEYAFMGSLIIREVVNELLTKGLDKAKVLLLAGSSAGGLGVMLNVDRVAEQLLSQGHGGVQVRGLPDSAWLPMRKPHKSADCRDATSCPPIETAKRGYRYWRSVLPETCIQTHLGEEWKCFFAPKIYLSLKSPIFVVQWLFDEAQLILLNINLTGRPFTEGQWRFMHNLEQQTRATLRDVAATFVPACMEHILLTRANWIDFRVKGTSLPRALHCWDRSLQESNHINGSHGSHGRRRSRTPPTRGCPFHLMDGCSWPQCNPTCPAIYDEATGQEVSAAQVLRYMGLDVQQTARQQGMDARTLLEMLSGGGG
ncbi:inactive palmitoleoyl-protein carboxylesterase notum1b [Nelusetta ayraudi]|uniref:inactive palmitoleoyl-protein carboxylesterase notum1b n=1 Tax=Nelusetta ayraudi TaxID=303726 RepID=UPI003F721F51